MQNYYSLPLIILCTLIFCSSSAAQEEPDKPQYLRFHWPVGLTAKVEKEHIKESRGTDKPKREPTILTYRLNVQPHDYGLVLRVDSVGLKSPNVADGKTAQTMLPLVAASQPDVIVSTDGEFLGVDNLSTIRSNVDSILGIYSKEAGELLDKMGLDMEDMILTEVGTDWSLLIESWLNTEIDLQLHDTTKEYVRSPMFPSVIFPMTQVISPMEWVPCVPDDTSSSCIKIVVRRAMDTTELRKSLVAMVEALTDEGAKEMGKAIQGFYMQETTTLIIEPDGMIPHMLVFDKRVMSSQNTKQSPMARELKITRFSYDIGIEER